MARRRAKHSQLAAGEAGWPDYYKAADIVYDDIFPWWRDASRKAFLAAPPLEKPDRCGNRADWRAIARDPIWIRAGQEWEALTGGLPWLHVAHRAGWAWYVALKAAGESPANSCIVPTRDMVDVVRAWALIKKSEQGHQPQKNLKQNGTNVAVSLGDRRYQVGESAPFVLTDSEDTVVQALIELAACEKEQLENHSGKSDAVRILATVTRKYAALAPFIVLPGGKGKGGYRTSIRAATTTPPSAHHHT